MNKEFTQIQWDQQLEADVRQLARLAIREDLNDGLDVTTRLLVPDERRGRAVVVARAAGVACGLRVAPILLAELNVDASWQTHVEDGAQLLPGSELATIEGSAQGLLTAERLLLNMIGRLSGIATSTRRYVDEVRDTKARIYDTRKTTPGWRRLEKYAVRCGGGHNHRLGLHDAVLIKDNHLALVAQSADQPMRPGQAVKHARARLHELLPDKADSMIVEIEVDTIEQLDDVLPEQPDIILLDNMPPDQLSAIVAQRNALGVATELEASGGVDLTTVRRIAETGIDRISIGALTHSAVSLDIGLDWCAQ